MATVETNPPRTSRDDTIVELGSRVVYLATEIADYLKSSLSPEPRLSLISSATAPPEQPEYEALRASLNDTVQDLLYLINGPKNTLRDLFFSHYGLAAFQVALERDFFKHVPLPSDTRAHKLSQPLGASVAEIAAKAGMDEDRTARILRYLATRRIFKRVKDGSEEHFEHTASSAMLANDSGWRALGTMQMDEMFKAASAMSTAIERSPYEADVENSAFHARFGVPLYQYYETNTDKATRFAEAMGSWSQLDSQFAALQRSFDWESLGSGKVVDIGGGSGHISIRLAKNFPTLNFVVQDISNHMLAQAGDLVTLDIRDRLTFQQHDFFSPQPVHDASAFLIRQCLHNYNDEDCIKLLRALVPALEKCNRGTPLLINEIILPEAGAVARYEEHSLRQLDLLMMVVLGSKQRSVREFDDLLKRADSRFKIIAAKPSPFGNGLVIVHLAMNCCNSNQDDARI